jgi:hypothetical protein
VSAPRQDEFGGGIFRSPRAPQGCVYDCVNGLIDDELAIYRRGGVSYRTNVDLGGGVQIVGLADGRTNVDCCRRWVRADGVLDGGGDARAQSAG